MHSLHQVRTHNNGATEQQIHQMPQDQILAVTTNQRQQQQEDNSKIQQQQHQQRQQLLIQSQNQLDNMTILDQAQTSGQQQQRQPAPILSALDPVQDQRQAALHHIVSSTPNLHQLQPSLQEVLAGEDQQQQQQQQQQQPGNHQHDQQDQGSDSSQQIRSRSTHIENLVADAGGPIVAWLHENYEVSDGESLPRSTVYNHYLAHCRHMRMSSVNAASFGKLIRSVFVSLKTRRLGTRGHSKYHYFGIRAKQDVHLEWLSEGASGHAGPHDQATSAGCSSNLLGDSNDAHSNLGTDGSESDSTGGEGNGRSSSMLSSSSGNKRLRRSHESDSYTIQDHQQYRTHNNHARKHHAIIQYPDQTLYDHCDQQQQHHLHNLQGTNGTNMYYHNSSTGTDSNGYDKHEMGSNHSIPFGNAIRYDQYDLSSLKTFLGPGKGTLVDENWPERGANLFERIQQQQQQPPPQEVHSGGSIKSPENNHSNQHLLTSRLIDLFEIQYKAYYKRMVELLSELQFNETEQLTMDFWHPTPAPAAHETIHWTSTTSSGMGGTSSCEVSPESTTNNNNSETTGTGTSTQHHATSYLNYGQQQDTHHQHQQHNQLLQSQQQLLGLSQQSMMQSLDGLTFDELYLITGNPVMIERITQIDCRLYSALESFLIADMLGPLPRPLIHILRVFSRNICSWIENAIKEYPDEFVNEKLRSARAFEQALRRSTSINHLAVASRSVWTKQAIMHQMINDLNRLDTRDIELQVSSLMNASQEKTPYLETPSVSTSSVMMHLDRDEQHNHHYQDRQHHVTVQQAPDQCLESSDNTNTSNATNNSNDNTSKASQRPIYSSNNQSNDNIENNYTDSNHHEDTNDHNLDGLSAASNLTGFQPNNNSNSIFCSSFEPSQLVQNFLHLLVDPQPTQAWPEWCRSLVESRVSGQSFEEAKNFILKWNFYISLMLRELTLRSAPSLGSFQLVRMLFDEYLYYLVVKRVAQVQQKTSTQLLRPSTRFDNI